MVWEFYYFRESLAELRVGHISVKNNDLYIGQCPDFSVWSNKFRGDSQPMASFADDLLDENCFPEIIVIPDFLDMGPILREWNIILENGKYCLITENCAQVGLKVFLVGLNLEKKYLEVKKGLTPREAFNRIYNAANALEQYRVTYPSGATFTPDQYLLERHIFIQALFPKSKSISSQIKSSPDDLGTRDTSLILPGSKKSNWYFINILKTLIEPEQKPYIKKTHVDFKTWIQHLKDVEQLSIKYLEDEEKYEKEIKRLKKRFFRARVFMFSVDFPKSFSSSEYKEIFVKLHNIIKNKKALENVLCDMFVIRSKLMGGTADETCDEMQAKIATFEGIWNGDDINFSKGGTQFSCNGVNLYALTTINFSQPELLTNILLDSMTIYVPHLLTTLDKCTNLTNLVFDAVVFIGNYSEKINLPKLRNFKITLFILLERELDLDKIDYYTFFGGKEACIWKSVEKLESYNIGTDCSCFKFDKSTSQLTYYGISISKHIPYNLFARLKMIDCKITLSEDKGDCWCTNCATSVVDYSDYKLKVVRCYRTSFINANRDKNSPGAFTRFFNRARFPNLEHLFIKFCDFNIDFLALTFIDHIQIQNSKICYRIPIDSGQVKNRNSEICKIQKKLSFTFVIFVDERGNFHNTFDLSFLAVENFEWSTWFSSNMHVMFDKLPYGLQKLNLKNVELLFPESATVNLSGILSTVNNLSTAVFSSSESSSLDLSLIPPSLKILKLENVSLSGEIPQRSNIKLDKIIFISCDLEDSAEASLASLLKKAQTVAISLEQNIFSSNIKKLFLRNVKTVYLARTRRWRRGLSRNIYLMYYGNSGKQSISKQDFIPQLETD